MKTVLVVEDYADVREIMNIYVRLQGYDALTANDGYEALEVCQEHKPDLILMDLALPLMDGIKATEILRETRNCRKVPIVAITAYQDSYYEKAIKAGCNEVLSKPIDIHRLESIFEKYLS